jgi:hypothetical protein
MGFLWLALVPSGKYLQVHKFDYHRILTNILQFIIGLIFFSWMLNSLKYKSVMKWTKNSSFDIDGYITGTDHLTRRSAHNFIFSLCILLLYKMEMQKSSTQQQSKLNFN